MTYDIISVIINQYTYSVPFSVSNTESLHVKNYETNNDMVFTYSSLDNTITFTPSELDGVTSFVLFRYTNSDNVVNFVVNNVNNKSLQRAYEHSKDIAVEARDGANTMFTDLSNRLDSKIDSDNVYTKLESDFLLSGKADITDVYYKDYIDTQLSTKANSNNVYSIAQIDTLLSGKSDLTYVNTQLGLKANQATTYSKTEVDNMVVVKSDLTYVNAQLANKQNVGVSYTKAEVNAILSTKADVSSVYTKTQVDTQLATKADTSSVYTKTQTDTLLNSKLNTSMVGVNNGVAPLDSNGKVPLANIPDSLLGAMNYRGIWDASTNTPSLTSSVGTKGYYYKVSVNGTTNLDGKNTWTVGDLVIFNGSTWDQVQGDSDLDYKVKLLATASIIPGFVSEYQITDTNYPYYNDQNYNFRLSFPNTTTLRVGNTGPIYFVDNVFNPTVSSVKTFSQFDYSISSLSLPHDGVYVMYVGINKDGQLIFSQSTLSYSSTIVQLGSVLIKRNAGVNLIASEFVTPVTTLPNMASVNNLQRVQMPLSTNINVHPSGSNLNIAHNAFSVFAESVNFGSDNAHKKDFSSSNSATMVLLSPSILTSGAIPSYSTNIDPNNYWNGSTVTAIGGSANSTTIQRFLLSINGRVIVQYGQFVYPDFESAKSSIDIAPFTTLLPDSFAVEIGKLVVKKGATNLSDLSQAYFHSSNMSTSGGGSGGGSVDAYTKSETDSLLALKSDLSYVNTQLVLKANQSTTYTKLETDALFAFKADTSYVDTQLSSKADTSYVDAQLGLKANQSTTYTKTETDSLLSNKADTSYVDAQLGLKADASNTYDKTYVDTQLATKSDVANTYTKAESDSLLSAKANSADVYTKTESDSLLSAKANSADVYTKTEVDSKTNKLKYITTISGPTGSFTVPAGVTRLYIKMCGAGGAGGGGANVASAVTCGGGGGAGGFFNGYLDVVPGINLSYTRADGGTGVLGNNGNSGGTSTLTYLGSAVITCTGGSGGIAGGASGGTGGSSGTVSTANSTDGKVVVNHAYLLYHGFEYAVASTIGFKSTLTQLGWGGTGGLCMGGRAPNGLFANNAATGANVVTLLNATSKGGGGAGGSGYNVASTGGNGATSIIYIEYYL